MHPTTRLLVLLLGLLLVPAACADRPGEDPTAPRDDDRPAPPVVPGPLADEKASDWTAAVAAPIAGSQPTPDIEDMVCCEVVRVVDGDTIKVRYNGRVESVRYIGIDTPETVHPSRPVEPFGPEASALNKALLTEGTVYLSFDLEQRDHYGRLLAYVYAVHDRQRIFVNLEIVRAGLARAFPYAPNTAYAGLFRQTEVEARGAHRGIWSD